MMLTEKITLNFVVYGINDFTFDFRPRSGELFDLLCTFVARAFACAIWVDTTRTTTIK
jgi:hypothetical protein